MSEQLHGTSAQKKRCGNSSNKRCCSFRRAPRKKSLTDGPAVDKHLPTRQVFVDTSLLPKLPERNLYFASNRISTTKYNWFNFIPKSLAVQFLRASNVYFLITTILICIPGFSVLPAYSSIGPLAFVLLMSMMREAYEDYKRRRNDNVTNNQRCRVLRKQSPLDPDQVAQVSMADQTEETYCKYEYMFNELKWADVKCGDIILVKEGEYFPADCVLLMSSSDNDECFVQTSSLDGERALKHKQCLAPIKHAVLTQGLNHFQGFIHSEQPNKNLYVFKGYMESVQFPEKNTILLSPESNLRTVSLDNKQLALRGSNLANTKWLLGAVVFTGKQTKLMMNQGQSRFKISKIEKLVNAIVIYLIIFQAIMCLLMAIFSGWYTNKYGDLDGSQISARAAYIFFSGTMPDTATVEGEDDDSYTFRPGSEGAKAYAQYYILLNTVIPISLVVSIEFVKLIQTPFMAHDVKMYDPETMKQCQPLSLTLHEELGFINYVFADKTGTLTSNVMQFMGCTVGSVCYDEDYKDDDYDYEVDPSSVCGKTFSQDEILQLQEESKQDQDFQEIDLDQDVQSKVDEFEQIKQQQGYPFNKKGGKSRMNRRNSATEIIWDFNQATAIIRGLLEQRKFFFNEEINLGKSEPTGNALIMRKQNEYLRQFWLNVTLCHDVIATKHSQTNALAYQGTSPDEITLLDAAKEVGFIFANRDSESLQVEIFGTLKTFYIRQKIEFSSDRKKMSVVVEDPETGLLILYCKGADFAIFERLSLNLEQHFLEATKEDLVKFSTKGFRTLCFAMRILGKEYYNNWLQRYEQAKLEQIKLGFAKNKMPKEDEMKKQKEINILEQLHDELESELFLVGATALEDKLQEGVPEVIDDFHNAGIKVWMLTGDKLETAENIGFSSRMFNEKMFIFKLHTGDREATRLRLNQIESKIIEIKSQHECPIIGTQFVLNPNAGNEIVDPQGNMRGTFQSAEARNIIKALEEYKHETIGSMYTLNESWARKPLFRRKIRRRIEEIAPDKAHIIDRLIQEYQFFKPHRSSSKYIPSAFDMKSKQIMARRRNVYRSHTTASTKASSSSIIDNDDTFGIIIEGQTLHHITESASMKKKFLKILGKCQAVVVCRASPSQKAVVVQMVKENEPAAITLAIGDGANDVNMIQKAHIGIGLFGKEGYQAAGSADYAIGQFQFLRRLMFVHGRWNGMRLSNFVLFFFHKNLVFTLPQFWFGWQNGFSGQTFWNDAYLTMFNTLITAFALGEYAIWEQDINFNNHQRNMLIELFFPFIYRDSQSDMFTKSKFFVWFGISIVQSLFIYGIPMIAFDGYIFPEGHTADLWVISTCAFFAVVHLHYVMLIIFTRNWTLWAVSWYVLNYLFFTPMFIFIYDSITNDTPMADRLIEIVYSNGIFWLVTILALAATILPIYFYFAVQNLFFPTLRDLIIQDKINYQVVIKEADPRRLKATQDMFKQQQQQQQLLWQLEYQNLQMKQANGQPIQSDKGLSEEDYIQLPKMISEMNLPRKGKGLHTARSLGVLIRQLSEFGAYNGRMTQRQLIQPVGTLDQFEHLDRENPENHDDDLDLGTENYQVDDSYDRTELASERKKMGNYLFRGKDVLPGNEQRSVDQPERIQHPGSMDQPGSIGLIPKKEKIESKETIADQ